MTLETRIIIGLLILVTYSCNSDDDSNDSETIFFWNQTACGEPWNTGGNNSNEETQVAVTQYLESEDITVNSLGFDNNSPLDIRCESCGCGTGQRIIVGVGVSDISKIGLATKKWTIR